MSTLQQRLWLYFSPDYGLCILIPGALFRRNRGWSCLWLTMPLHCLTHTGCGHLLVKGCSALWASPRVLNKECSSQSVTFSSSPCRALKPGGWAHTWSFISSTSLFYFLAALRAVWDLSSSTRDQTGAHCIEIAVLTTGQPGKLYSLFLFTFSLYILLYSHFLSSYWKGQAFPLSPCLIKIFCHILHFSKDHCVSVSSKLWCKWV